MWIMTQNKQRIINSDHIADIFVNKAGDTIYAETTLDRDFFTLGEYDSRDLCLEFLDIYLSLLMHDFRYLKMPEKDELADWCLEVHKRLGSDEGSN